MAMNPAPTLLQVPVIPAPRPVLTAPDDSRLALVMWTKVADVSLSAAIDVSAVECSRSTSLCCCCRGLRPLRIAIYGDLQLRMMPRGLMCFHWERTVAIYQSGSRSLKLCHAVSFCTYSLVEYWLSARVSVMLLRIWSFELIETVSLSLELQTPGPKV